MSDVETQQSSMDRSSKILIGLLFVSICASVGLTYFHTIVREDYAVFTNPDTVPDAADFFAYLVSAAESYFTQ